MITSFAQRVASVLILIVLCSPTSYAQSDVVAEVTETIQADAMYARENLVEADNMSADGVLAFWSSGGLLQVLTPETPKARYDDFNVYPKHITVIPLGDDVAVAMYYSEGSMIPVSSAPVPDYRTRVTEIYVKEDGRWVRRASHWSPLQGGSGTSATTIDED